MLVQSAAAWGLSLLTVALVLPLLLPRLRTWGALDVPEGRSSHSVVTPRGAGLAVFTGVTVSIVVFRAVPLAAVLAMALMCALGAVDDFRSVSATLRLGVQASTGLLLGALLAQQRDDSGLVGVALTAGLALELVATVNAVNFMDGINGITGIHAVLWGGTYWAVLSSEGDTWALGCAALAGSAVAFLPFNLPRARVFLGDSGSYFVGAFVALIAAHVALTVGPLVGFAPLTIYAIDTAMTVASRARRREPLTRPHRDHIYQRLADRLDSHVKASFVVATASLVCCVGGVAFARDQFVVGWLLCVSAAAVYAGLSWWSRRTRVSEDPEAGDQPITHPGGASREPGE